MKVALLGTGLMGRPMAERLLKQGQSLIVYNRTREKAAPLADLGAEIAETPKPAVEAADCTLLMLADIGAIRSCLFPDEGPAPSLSGRTILQMGTVSPDQSLSLLKDVTDAGGDYLEAPVLGSFPEVQKRSLVVMAGARPEQFKQWLPLLRTFSPHPLHVGEVPKGAALKLALNHLIASLTTAFSYSLGMVRRRGVNVDLFMNVVRNSSVHSDQFDKKLDRMLSRDFSDPHFPTKHLLKDVQLIVEEGRSTGLSVEPAEAVRAIVQKALDMGLVETDYSSLYNAVDPA